MSETLVISRTEFNDKLSTLIAEGNASSESAEHVDSDSDIWTSLHTAFGRCVPVLTFQQREDLLELVDNEAREHGLDANDRRVDFNFEGLGLAYFTIDMLGALFAAMEIFANANEQSMSAIRLLLLQVLGYTVDEVDDTLQEDICHLGVCARRFFPKFHEFHSAARKKPIRDPLTLWKGIVAAGHTPTTTKGKCVKFQEDDESETLRGEMLSHDVKASSSVNDLEELELSDGSDHSGDESHAATVKNRQHQWSKAVDESANISLNVPTVPSVNASQINKSLNSSSGHNLSQHGEQSIIEISAQDSILSHGSNVLTDENQIPRDIKDWSRVEESLDGTFARMDSSNIPLMTTEILRSLFEKSLLTDGGDDGDNQLADIETLCRYLSWSTDSEAMVEIVAQQRTDGILGSYLSWDALVHSVRAFLSDPPANSEDISQSQSLPPSLPTVTPEDLLQPTNRRVIVDGWGRDSTDWEKASKEKDKIHMPRLRHNATDDDWGRDSMDWENARRKVASVDIVKGVDSHGDDAEFDAFVSAKNEIESQIEAEAEEATSMPPKPVIRRVSSKVLQVGNVSKGEIDRAERVSKSDDKPSESSSTEKGSTTKSPSNAPGNFTAPPPIPPPASSGKVKNAFSLTAVDSSTETSASPRKGADTENFASLEKNVQLSRGDDTVNFGTLGNPRPADATIDPLATTKRVVDTKGGSKNGTKGLELPPPRWPHDDKLTTGRQIQPPPKGVTSRPALPSTPTAPSSTSEQTSPTSPTSPVLPSPPALRTSPPVLPSPLRPSLHPGPSLVFSPDSARRSMISRETASGIIIEKQAPNEKKKQTMWGKMKRRFSVTGKSAPRPPSPKQNVDYKIAAARKEIISSGLIQAPVNALPSQRSPSPKLGLRHTVKLANQKGHDGENNEGGSATKMTKPVVTAYHTMENKPQTQNLNIMQGRDADELSDWMAPPDETPPSSRASSRTTTPQRIQRRIPPKSAPAKLAPGRRSPPGRTRALRAYPKDKEREDRRYSGTDASRSDFPVPSESDTSISDWGDEHTAHTSLAMELERVGHKAHKTEGKNNVAGEDKERNSKEANKRAGSNESPEKDEEGTGKKQHKDKAGDSVKENLSIPYDWHDMYGRAGEMHKAEFYPVDSKKLRYLIQEKKVEDRSGNFHRGLLDDLSTVGGAAKPQAYVFKSEKYRGKNNTMEQPGRSSLCDFVSLRSKLDLPAALDDPAMSPQSVGEVGELMGFAQCGELEKQGESGFWFKRYCVIQCRPLLPGDDNRTEGDIYFNIYMSYKPSVFGAIPIALRKSIQVKVCQSLMCFFIFLLTKLFTLLSCLIPSGHLQNCYELCTFETESRIHDILLFAFDWGG